MPEQIDTPYQLVCEGKADEVFFRRLLLASGKVVNVSCPKPEPDGASGREAIRRRLVAFQSKFDTITRVVVVIDSDDDPAGALGLGQEEFRQANLANPAKQYPIPQAANVIADGNPQTAIVQVPNEVQRGCLDTLLLPSFEERYAGATLGCVHEFCQCVGDPARSYTFDSKLRLRSLISATVFRNPGISLSFLLEERNCPIAISHASFDPIRATLIGLFP